MAKGRKSAADDLQEMLSGKESRYPAPKVGLYDFIQGNVSAVRDRQDIGVDLLEHNESYVRELADTQTKFSKAGRAATVFGGGLVAGFLDNIASYDLGNVKEMWDGNGKEYGNAITKFTGGFMDDLRENNKIHQYNPGGFNMDDFGWWAQHLGDQGYSAGLAVGMILETYATGGLGIGLKALTGLNKARSLSSSVQKLNNFKKLFDAGNIAKTTNQVKNLKQFMSTSSTLAHGGFKGMQEAYINGVQNYHQAKKGIKIKHPELTDKQVNDFALDAAHKGFRNEVGVSMIMNTFQIGALKRYNSNTGRMTDRKVSLGALVGSKPLKKGIEYAENMASEAFEEVWQAISGKEGEYKALVAAKLAPTKSEGERYKEYLSSSEIHNAAFGGALGGGIFQGMADTSNAIKKKMGIKSNADFQREFIEGRVSELTNKLKDLDGREQSNTNLRSSNAAQVLASLSIDKANDNTSSFDSIVALHQDIVNTLESGDTDAIAEMKAKHGITITDAQLLETSKGLIEDSNSISEINKKYQNEADHRISEYLTAVEFNGIVAERAMKESGKEVEDIVTEFDIPAAQLARLKLNRLELALDSKETFVDMSLTDVLKAKDAMLARKAELEMEVRELSAVEERDGVTPFKISKQRWGDLAESIDSFHLSEARKTMSDSELARMNNPEAHSRLVQEKLKQAKREDLSVRHNKLSKRNDEISKSLTSINDKVDGLKKSSASAETTRKINELMQAHKSLLEEQKQVKGEMKQAVMDSEFFDSDVHTSLRDVKTPHEQDISRVSESLMKEEKLEGDDIAFAEEHKEEIDIEIQRQKDAAIEHTKAEEEKLRDDRTQEEKLNDSLDRYIKEERSNIKTRTAQIKKGYRDALAVLDQERKDRIDQQNRANPARLVGARVIFNGKPFTIERESHDEGGVKHYLVSKDKRILIENTSISSQGIKLISSMFVVSKMTKKYAIIEGEKYRLRFDEFGNLLEIIDPHGSPITNDRIRTALDIEMQVIDFKSKFAVDVEGNMAIAKKVDKDLALVSATMERGHTPQIDFTINKIQEGKDVSDIDALEMLIWIESVLRNLKRAQKRSPSDTLDSSIRVLEVLVEQTYKEKGYEKRIKQISSNVRTKKTKEKSFRRYQRREKEKLQKAYKKELKKIEEDKAFLEYTERQRELESVDIETESSKEELEESRLNKERFEKLQPLLKEFHAIKSSMKETVDSTESSRIKEELRSLENGLSLINEHYDTEIRNIKNTDLYDQNEVDRLEGDRSDETRDIDAKIAILKVELIAEKKTDGYKELNKKNESDKSELKTSLNDIQAQIDQINNDTDAAIGLIPNLNDVSSDLIEAKRKYSEIEAKYAVLFDELEKKKPVKGDDFTDEEQAHLDNLLKIHQDEINEIESEINKIEDQLNDPNFDGDIDALEARQNELSDNVDSATISYNETRDNYIDSLNKKTSSFDEVTFENLTTEEQSVIDIFEKERNEALKDLLEEKNELGDQYDIIVNNDPDDLESIEVLDDKISRVNESIDKIDSEYDNHIKNYINRLNMQGYERALEASTVAERELKEKEQEELNEVSLDIEFLDELETELAMIRNRGDKVSETFFGSDGLTPEGDPEFVLNSGISNNTSKEDEPNLYQEQNEEAVRRITDHSDDIKSFKDLVKIQKIMDKGVSLRTVTRLADGWNALFGSIEGINDGDVARIFLELNKSATYPENDSGPAKTPTKVAVTSTTNSKVMSGVAHSHEMFYFTEKLEVNRALGNKLGDDYDQNHDNKSVTFSLGTQPIQVKTALGTSDERAMKIKYQVINILDEDGNKIGELADWNSLKGLNYKGLGKLMSKAERYKDDPENQDPKVLSKIDKIQKAKELFRMRKDIIDGKKVKGVMRLQSTLFATDNKDAFDQEGKTMAEADPSSRVLVWDHEASAYLDSSGKAVNILNYKNTNGSRIIEARPYKDGHVGFSFRPLTFLSPDVKNTVSHIFNKFLFNDDNINGGNSSTKVSDEFDIDSFSNFKSTLRKYVYTLSVQFSNEQKKANLSHQEVVNHILNSDDFISHAHGRVTTYIDDVHNTIYLVTKDKDGDHKAIMMYKNSKTGKSKIKEYEMSGKSMIEVNGDLNENEFKNAYDAEISDKFIMHRPDFRHHDSNSTVNIINKEDGSISSLAYDDFLTQNIKTNVESVEIEGRPVSIRSVSYSVSYIVDDIPANSTPVVDPTITTSDDTSTTPPDTSTTEKEERFTIINEIKVNDIMSEILFEAEEYYKSKGILDINDDDIFNDDDDLKSKIFGEKFTYLSRSEKVTLSRAIKHDLLNSSGDKHSSIKDVHSHYNKIIKEQDDKINSLIKKYNRNRKGHSKEDNAKMDNFFSLMERDLKKLNELKDNIHGIIKEEANVLDKKMKNKAFDQKEEGDVDNMILNSGIVDQDGSLEKDVTKSSEEIDIKDKLKPELKKFLLSVDSGQKGFMGIPIYKDDDLVHRELLALFGSKSSWTIEEVLLHLDENVENREWYGQIASMLRKSNHQTKVQFLMMISQRPNEFIYVSITSKKDDEGNHVKYVVKTIDSRQSVIKKAKLNQWAQNRRFDKHKMSLYKERLDQIIAAVELKNGTLTVQDTKDLLEIVGIIDLHPKTVENVFNSKIRNARYKDIFDLKNSKSIISGAKKFLKGYNLDLNYQQKTLEAIAYDESSNAELLVVKSILDGGKRVSGYSDSRYMNDVNDGLKDAEYRQSMKGLTYTGDSVYLDVLDQTKLDGEELVESPAVKDFRIVDDGITVLNDNGESKIQKDVNFLSHQRNVISKYQVGSGVKGQTYTFKDHNGIEIEIKYNMRMLPFPAISDHGRTISQVVPAFQIRNLLSIVKGTVGNPHKLILDESAFIANNPNEYGIVNKKIKGLRALKAIIYKSIIYPELNSIMNSIGQDSKYSRIDKYGQVFVQFHSLNLVKERESDELTIIQRIAKGENLTNKMIDMLSREVITKIVEETNNDFEKDRRGNQIPNSYHSNDDSALSFKNKKRVLNGELEIKNIENIGLQLISSAIEFNINHHINQANILQLYVGHPSQLISYDINKDKDPFDFNEEELNKMASVFEANYTKRNKAFLSPRTSVVSKNSRFQSIELRDNYIVSKSMAILIEMKYSKAKAAKFRKDTKGSDPIDIRNYVNKHFEELSSFAKIEETDAQEYVTVARYLDILLGSGSISKKKHDDFMAKHRKYSKLKPKEKTIDAAKSVYGEDFFEIIFQNKKGIYTGSTIDGQNNRLRMNFIKSSIFPLLDITTAGRELDHLRKAMEGMEKKNGMFVHASYSSANKLGGLKDPLTIWDSNGVYIGDPSKIENATSTLESKYFGLQMENPFKLGKTGDQYINSTTQMLKALFGDGVISINDGFGPNNLSGKEFYEEYKNALHELGIEKVNKLKSELYLDDNFNVKKDKEHKTNDRNKVLSAIKIMNKFKNNLERNGADPDEIDKIKLKIVARFVKQDKLDNLNGTKETVLIELDNDQYEQIVNRGNEALLSTLASSSGLEAGRHLKGNSIENIKIESVDFEVPLLFQNQGKSHESVLNSIIKDDVINLKLPGTSYILTSPVGFNQIGDQSKKGKEIVNNSAFIKVKSFFNKDGLDSIVKDGGINYANVYVSPKFKHPVTGKVINFYEKDSNGKYIYLIETLDGLELNEDMIDSNLLEFPSVRIPTSSHKMMTVVRIAGFLPPGNADTMIVPSEFTTRKGLDFDIDKETAYNKNIFVEENGKIVVLEDHYDKSYNPDSVILELESKLNDLKLKYNDKVKLSKVELGRLMDLAVNENNDFNFEETFNDEITHKEFLDALNSLKNQIQYQKSVKLKLKENKLIDLISSVLKNPKVQAKMNNTLSTEYGEQQAILFSQKKDMGSVLSARRQNEIMYSNMGSLTGVGIFANAYALTGFMQGKGGTKLDLEIGFGDLEFKGDMFPLNNLKQAGIPKSYYNSFLKRSTADAIEEILNLNLDNGTIQAIGKLGMDSNNMGAVSALIMLGHDKVAVKITKEVYDQNKDSILYQKHETTVKGKPVTTYYHNTSAPVLYAKATQLSPSEKVSNKINAVNQGKKDEVDHKPLSFDEIYRVLFEGAEPDYSFFMKLDQLTENLKNTQYALDRMMKPISVTKKGFLGKTVFEKNLIHQEEIKAIVDVFKGNTNIELQNLKDVYGDIQVFKGGPETPLGDGYIFFGSHYDHDVYIKPDNYYSNAMVSSFVISAKLWDEYLPYNFKPFVEIMKNMTNSMGDKDVDAAKLVLGKYKDFVMTKGDNFLFVDRDGYRQTNMEARNYLVSKPRQLIGNAIPQHFSEYIHNVLYNKETNKHISSNLFLKNLQLSISKGKSLITVIGNQTLTKFQEEDIKDAFFDMIQRKVELPPFNGGPYNSKMLAFDLMKYDIVSNRTSKRDSFSKYIPEGINKHLNINQMLREANITKNDGLGKRRELELSLANFADQFMIQSGDIKTVVPFRDATVLTNTDIRTKKDSHPYYIVHNKKVYKRVFRDRYTYIGDSITSGHFDFNQTSIQISNENQNIIDNSSSKFSKESMVDQLTDGMNSAALLHFAARDPKVAQMMELFGFKKMYNETNESGNLKFKIVPFKEGDDKNSFQAQYDVKNRTISIREDIVNDPQIKQLVFKEMMHHVTVHKMASHFNRDGSLKTGASVEAVKLHKVFNELKNIINTNSDYAHIKNHLNSGIMGDKDTLIAHAFDNIFEFISEVSIDSELWKFLKKIDTKHDKTFVDRIKSLFHKLMNLFSGSNYKDESLLTVMDFLYGTYDMVDEFDQNFIKYNQLSSGTLTVDLNIPATSKEDTPEINALYKQLELLAEEIEDLDKITDFSINEDEVTEEQEDGTPCGSSIKKAEKGARGNFSAGGKWELVKDLKGYPSHAKGGVDVTLGESGSSFKGKKGDIKASHGLVLSKIEVDS